MFHPEQDRDVITLCGHILRSAERVGNRLLVPPDRNLEKRVQDLYELKGQVVVFHRFEDTPRFRFANQSAQFVFGYSWKEFMGMDSRQSAEPMALAEREKLLVRAQEHGYIDDYKGMRVRKDGWRFPVRNVLLCNVKDERDDLIGQVAVFKNPDQYFPPVRSTPSGPSTGPSYD